MLKLMYITNSPEVASIADGAGGDRIFIDLEQYGKEKRQKNWDSVKSKHSISDIPKVKSAVKNAQIFVRTDPIFDGFSDELEGVLACEPDVVMLPYFKTVREVETFIKAVDGRATTSLLLETREAAEQIDDIISVGGIDEIHIGLNDLSHSYGKKFLFEELADGTVDRLVERFKADGIKNYGFGGIASAGRDDNPRALQARLELRDTFPRILRCIKGRRYRRDTPHLRRGCERNTRLRKKVRRHERTGAFGKFRGSQTAR